MYFRAKRLFGVLAVFIASFVFSTFTAAQYTTGTVQGTIFDPSGAAVGGAQVTLRSVETNATRAFTTREDGIYRFAAVPPGRYELTTEAKGFAKTVTLLATTSNATVSENVKLAALRNSRSRGTSGSAPAHQG